MMIGPLFEPELARSQMLRMYPWQRRQYQRMKMATLCLAIEDLGLSVLRRRHQIRPRWKSLRQLAAERSR